MADLKQLSDALVKADAAGNTSDAKVFANAIRQLKGRTVVPTPSYADVARNAAAKGAAGIPDMFLDAPTNLLNLGKAGVGFAAGEFGRPDIAAGMELSEPPSLAKKALTKLDLINAKREPQTTGQRILDTAIQAGVSSLANPVKSLGQMAGNVATGALTGGAAEGVKEATGSDLAKLAVGLAGPPSVQKVGQMARTKIANLPAQTVREKTFREGQQLGYKVPPSSLNPSFLNEKLESIGGKAMVGQAAAGKNQPVTNRAMAAELGLPQGTELTPEVLRTWRDKTAQPYREVANLSPLAKQAWERIQSDRLDAKDLWNKYARNPDPDVRKQAQRLDTLNEVRERAIDKVATKYGKPDLVERLREARKAFAKSYEIEKALNLGTADIDAHIIGRQLDKGRPLTGNLKTVGKFAEAFPSETRTNVHREGVSGTDAGMAALLAEGGLLATHSPYGLAAGLLPLVRGGARKLALSDPWQKYMTNPNLGAGTQLMSKIDPKTDLETALQSLLILHGVTE